MEYSQDRLKKIAEKYQLDFVILHGSQTSDKAKNIDSDIDVAVYRKGGIEADEFLKLYSDLISVFKGAELDLKTLHNKNPLFCYHVVKDGKLLYGDVTEYNELKAYYYQRRIDAQPLLDLEEKLVKKYQGMLTK